MKGKRVVGITGSIGSGKSSAAKYLGRFGFSVINADRLYRSLYKKGGVLHEKLLLAFGRGIGTKGGEINRKKLRSIVFSDPKKLRLLNRITHPEILRAAKKRIAASQKNIIIDAPLLFEAKFDSLCDQVIVVHCSGKVMLRRLLATRNLSRAEILRIKESQMPFSEKKKRADFVVDTSGSYAKTRRQLDRILAIIKKESKGIKRYAN